MVLRARARIAQRARARSSERWRSSVGRRSRCRTCARRMALGLVDSGSRRIARRRDRAAGRARCWSCARCERYAAAGAADAQDRWPSSPRFAARSQSGSSTAALDAGGFTEAGFAPGCATTCASPRIWSSGLRRAAADADDESSVLHGTPRRIRSEAAILRCRRERIRDRLSGERRASLITDWVARTSAAARPSSSSGRRRPQP